MTNRIDLVGKIFGRLTVIEHTNLLNRGGHRLWRCHCICGNSIIVPTGRLNAGVTKSCGCLWKPHGMSETKTYQIWKSMLKRCNNPNHKDYKNYGARGIKVCDKWLEFKNFLKDMGEVPNGTEIDRINNNLGYSKDNCRFTSHKINCHNTRSNRFITYKGETKTLSAWAEILNINMRTLKSRLDSKWPTGKAFLLPVRG